MTDQSSANNPCIAPVSLPPQLPPACCCDDPAEGLKQLFVNYFQGRSMAAGRNPATRPVFLRLHGVAHGEFVIQDHLPAELQIGVFAQARSYPTWVRFSSDLQPTLPDQKGTVGIGIKLFDVAGEKVLAPDQQAQTHDFILQNFPVFFVDTAKDMCQFTYASLTGSGNQYLTEHPKTSQILDAMEQDVESVLSTTFWSVLPFKFGDRFAKYKLEPLDVPPLDQPIDLQAPLYLQTDLHQRLSNGQSAFKFMVQLQTNDHDMPLDQATVEWSETLSPPIHVATLILPDQDTNTRGQAAYGENLAFNTWHCLPEHCPVGSIADARKLVYQSSANNRRNVNGVPLAEPSEIRPTEYAPNVPYPKAQDTVVRAAIHPAIGVSRVGNSEEFWIGPQVIEPNRQEDESTYRDASGALKRQAAEFRIYGYNANDEVVCELTAGMLDVSVSWSVHVANSKAAWYQWQLAMDIPEAQDLTLDRRNKDVTGDARALLTIDAGLQSTDAIGGNQQHVDCAGHFEGTPVKLGELRFSEKKRLLFVPAYGKSESPTGQPIYRDNDDVSFINADGWYDDTCDGPVTAVVKIGQREIPVEGAWVISAPPNYAPHVKAERTMYDLMYDLFAQAGWLPTRDSVSFSQDVYPILSRLTDLQWVNQGFSTTFGHGGAYNFADPELLRKISQPPVAGEYDLYRELRQQILNSFRTPNTTDSSQQYWPWIYGDAMQVDPSQMGPRQNVSITQTQYNQLQAWAEGKFMGDWGHTDPAPTAIDQVKLTDQPAMLDRAAMEFCLADAFHPGCEMTWPMRHLTMYHKPFRIRHRPAGAPTPDYGDTLNQAQTLSPQGPLYAQGAGDITRWMGLPWQADTAYCRSGYDHEYDPFLPTFWPARVPNQVLSSQDYATVINPDADLQQRLVAYGKRTNWNEPLKRGVLPTDTPYQATVKQMMNMVHGFDRMGLLIIKDGVPDDPYFPSQMMVASFKAEEAPEERSLLKATAPSNARTHSANYASSEEARRVPVHGQIKRKS